MEKSKCTSETTAQHKLESLKHVLKASFCRTTGRTSSPVSDRMFHDDTRATYSIDRFAFLFKNNLHRLAKLGEPVESTSPQFIIFPKRKQIFRSTWCLTQKNIRTFRKLLKPQNEWSVHLAPAEATVHPTNGRSTHPALLPQPQALLYPEVTPKNSVATTVILQVLSRTTVLIQPHETTTLTTSTAIKWGAAYGTNISSPRAPYRISHVNLAD